MGGSRPEAGLRVKLALDDAGVVGGMIQYLPIEQSDVDGKGLYFIYCIWVHGHPQGRGNFQKRGMGTALLEAAEEDARSLGATGMAAWGVALPFWMKASWFKKHGYRKADRQGMMVLLWKPFADDAEPPRWFPKAARSPSRCPARSTSPPSRAAGAWRRTWSTSEPSALRPSSVTRWRFARSTPRARRGRRVGPSDAVLVDGKILQKGPPPSYEKIRKAIAKRVRRLPR